MRVSELTSGMPIRLRDPSAGSIEVREVVEDSRAVRPGSLFIARPGRTSDGRTFIGDAVRAGAVAVLTDAEGAAHVPSGAAALVSADVARDGAVLAERCAGEPTKQLHLVGVTGTNGKSTVVEFVQQLLQADGRRCGLIGTVHVDDGRERKEATLTTPGAPELSALFGRMAQHGCDSAAMEVSSHALDQERAAGLHFNTAIFTNLTGDHQDYHGTMEAYAGAKAKLFAQLDCDGLAIVNADDAAHERMLRDCGARVLRCRCEHMASPERKRRGEGSKSANQQISNGTARVVVLGTAMLDGVLARFEGPWGAIEAHVPLIGAYNLQNALFAVAAAFETGVTPERIAHGLARLSAPPGRLERVGASDVHVFVDYAHTDDALNHVLCAVRKAMPEQAALRVVFGCGGDRDRTKRPRMGSAAARWADHLYVTSDNPRSEKPEAIIAEVVAGVPREMHAHTVCEADRRVAIERAIAEARAGDVVVIAGKGHEGYQETMGKRVVFDDVVVAEDALKRRDGEAQRRRDEVKEVVAP